MTGNKIISSIKWSSIEFAISSFFNFIIKLVLAKLLIPSDFGIVGMAIVFIALAQAISELGLGAALIQKKNDSDVLPLYNTAFWSGIIWGFLIFLFMSVVVAPFAVYFFKENILIKLIPILSLPIILKPINLIHNVILTRSLNFKTIALINNFSSLIGGTISLVASLYGLGLWSLALFNVLPSFIAIIPYFIVTKWYPKLKWDLKYFKQFFHFGLYTTGTSIVSTISYNIDNLLIGKFINAQALGAYSLGFNLTEVLRQRVSSVLNKVMFPVFSFEQDDIEKLKSYFLSIIKFNAIVLYPLLTVLLLFAKDIVGFFGNKWIDAIVPLQILSVAIMIHLLVNSFTSLLRALGKPRLELKILLIINIFILIPGLVIGIVLFELKGASIAILINKIVLTYVAIFYLKRFINISIMEIISSVRTALIGIAISGIIIKSIQYFFDYHIFKSIYLIVFIMIYAIIIYYFEKREIMKIFNQLKSPNRF